MAPIVICSSRDQRVGAALAAIDDTVGKNPSSGSGLPWGSKCQSLVALVTKICAKPQTDTEVAICEGYQESLRQMALVITNPDLADYVQQMLESFEQACGPMHEGLDAVLQMNP